MGQNFGAQSKFCTSSWFLCDSPKIVRIEKSDHLLEAKCGPFYRAQELRVCAFLKTEPKSDRFPGRNSKSLPFILKLRAGASTCAPNFPRLVSEVKSKIWPTCVYTLFRVCPKSTEVLRKWLNSTPKCADSLGFRPVNNSQFWTFSERMVRKWGLPFV